MSPPAGRRQRSALNEQSFRRARGQDTARAPHDGRVEQREAALTAAFVDLADGLLADFDVEDLLFRLSRHCVELLGSAACGVMLADGRDGLVVVAAFPPVARELDAVQLRLGQGPCLDCARSGQPVHSADLAADIDRWPQWVPVALGAGLRAVEATPMRLGDRVIGTLDIFGRTPALLAERDRLAIRALAGVATLTILRQHDDTGASLAAGELHAALAARVTVEHAKGVLAETLGVGMDEASAILGHRAETTGVSLPVVADQVVAGTLRLRRLHPPPA